MQFPLADSLSRIPGAPSARWPDGSRVDVVLEHNGLLFELYAPVGTDTQQPHTRDELYIVARGQALFVHHTARGRVAQEVSSGDALFVPAGDVHRFETFSPDFAAWVVFFGPEQ
ncbi:cupin domain-containing protein [Ideonella sp. A 288]|uniref:cupin domain-containing protein n=1 Tax=Ideonella sp. A 288 TaxID=1962181 RepID=UPI000B4ABE04|nr:cupin domain-containing protein [Ideonella sp. A 288]